MKAAIALLVILSAIIPASLYAADTGPSIVPDPANAFKVAIARSTAIAFSPDVQTIACGGSDGLLTLYDIKTKQTSNAQMGKAAVTSLTYSRSGKYLAAGCKDNTVLIMDSEKWACVQKLQVKSCPSALAFSGDDGLLAVGTNKGELSTWIVSTGNMCKQFEGHKRRVITVVFDNKQNLLVSASEDRTLKEWEYTNSGKIKRMLAWPEKKEILSATCADDCKVIAVGSNELTNIPGGLIERPYFFILDRDGTEIIKIPVSMEDTRTAALSYDGSLLAVAKGNGNLRIFDTKTGQQLAGLDKMGKPTAVAFSRFKGKLWFAHADAENIEGMPISETALGAPARAPLSGSMAVLPIRTKLTDENVLAALESTGFIMEAEITKLDPFAKVKFVTRTRLKQAMSELKLGESGLVDPDTAKQIGKLAGADYVVSGECNKVGNEFVLSAGILNVETGELIISDYINQPAASESVLIQMAQEVVRKIGKNW